MLTMDPSRLIEIITVILSLLYVILIIRQNIWCWICGILSSSLYIWSMIQAKIYLEAGLNFYYVVIGIYGWYLWTRKDESNQEKSKNELPVSKWNSTKHVINIGICIALSLVLGKLSQHITDSPRPYFDAFITVFSFGATFMEARKILSTWVYWFIINGLSIILMLDRDLPWYALLSGITTLLCIKGYLDWTKSYKDSQLT